MPNLNVTFPNTRGETLAGILNMPASTPLAYALFAHCFTCSKDIKAAANIARALNDEGIAVLRFDFTGLGDSEGAFADTNFSSNVADLLAAVDYLEKQHEAPTLLVGHSLGGTAILQAAPQVRSAVAVATIGSPFDPAHVLNLFGDAEDALQGRGEAEVNLGGRPFVMKRQFVEDLGEQSLQETVGALRKALLVMHAPLDNIVKIDNASELFRAAKHPKSFISLDNADHLLSRATDSRYVGHVLAAWASRYLPAAEVDEPLSASDGAVVARTLSSGFRTDIRSGRHALVAVEPRSVGGSDLGPSPYDFLAAALAACTSMTLQMYARHKKLPLESATVSVVHDKVHAEDCEDCESGAGKIDEFRRSIALVGELTDEQRARMLEIADRCPVHRTLHGEIKVRSALAET